MGIYFRLKAFIAHPELQAFIHAEYHGALLSRILHAHETTEALNEAQGICSRLLGLGLVALVWLGNMALLPVSALLPVRRGRGTSIGFDLSAPSPLHPHALPCLSRRVLTPGARPYRDPTVTRRDGARSSSRCPCTTTSRARTSQPRAR